MKGLVDRRTSIEIGISISLQLIKVALSLLGILGALLTFFIIQLDTNCFFVPLVVLSFLSFMLSIINGGKGIDKDRKKGFTGKWDLEVSKSNYDWQAKFLLIGTVFMFLIFLTGAKKENLEIKELKNITKELSDIKSGKKELEKIAKELEELKMEVKGKANIKEEKGYKMK